MSEPVSSTRRRILLISDIHYASDLERARGDYEPGRFPAVASILSRCIVA